MSKTPSIVVAEMADGPVVTDHPNTAAARRAALALRAAGVVAYVYPAAAARRLGLDPRVAA